MFGIKSKRQRAADVMVEFVETLWASVEVHGIDASADSPITAKLFGYQTGAIGAIGDHYKTDAPRAWTLAVRQLYGDEKGLRLREAAMQVMRKYEADARGAFLVGQVDAGAWLDGNKTALLQTIKLIADAASEVQA